MKKILILLIIFILIIPQITLAVWWNPFTWKIFKKSTETKTKETTNIPSGSKNTSFDITEQSSNIDQATEIEKLKKEIEELKKKTINTELKETTSKQVSPKTNKTTITIDGVEYETDINKQIKLCDSNGIIWFQVMDPVTKKIEYYNKINGQWIKESDIATGRKGINENFTRPAGAPSPAQLKRLMAICSLSEDVATTCSSPTFINGYFTNMAFRYLIDDLVLKTENKLEQQKKENEIAQQKYLLYLETIKQPAIESSIRHETYSLPSYSSSLKLEPLKVNSPQKWEIKWTGEGAGFIKDYSSGIQTNFLCDSSRCFTP